MLPRNRVASLLLSALAASSCHTGIVNPSLPVSMHGAGAVLDEMEESPRRPPRPIVLVGPFRGSGLGCWLVKRRLASRLSEPVFVSSSCALACSLESCSAALIREVEEQLPSDDPQWTREVDVIGLSMGGLVARLAAAPAHPDHPRKRLRIARLFTISSPHTGAALAPFLFWDPLAWDLWPSAATFERLAQEEAAPSYPIYGYVRLGDWIVGAAHAKPPGGQVWWLSDRWLVPSHIGAHLDDRILADILRRLRGEEPLSTLPPTPLPD